MMTQAEIVSEISDETGFAKGEIRHVLDVYQEVILAEINACEKVKIGQIVQLEVKIKPAQKKRKGRNPATGDEIMIKAKPASAVLRARVLKKAKDAVPSTQKAKKVLAAA